MAEELSIRNSASMEADIVVSKDIAGSRVLPRKFWDVLSVRL